MLLLRNRVRNPVCVCVRVNVVFCHVWYLRSLFGAERVFHCTKVTTRSSFPVLMYLTAVAFDGALECNLHCITCALTPL